MKTRSRLCRFQLKLLSYGNSYYIDRIAQLESALRRKPKALQLEMIGDGEIPADTALLIRSILMGRSPKTRLITNARSSLQNGSVLVWLMGDVRPSEMTRDYTCAGSSRLTKTTRNRSRTSQAIGTLTRRLTPKRRTTLKSCKSLTSTFR